MTTAAAACPVQRQIPIRLIVTSSRESVLIHPVEIVARKLGLPVLAGLQKPLHAPALRAALQRFPQLGLASAAPNVPPSSNRRGHKLSMAVNLIAKPIPASEMPQWIKRHQTRPADLRQD